MNKKTIFGVLAIFIVIASIAGVSAFAGKFSGMDQQGQSNMVNEKMSQMRGRMSTGTAVCNGEMEQALENGDYEAWKTVAVNSPMISNIQNEDDFKILVQLHQAMEDGNYTQVKELRDQLGLPGGPGKNKMSGNFGRGRMS
ncbi:MAG: hypothetical protein OIN87_05950 [Candidatus Methanoperedens sp.]|nr:hypothetical protein [Candidatus Methanoperedens sp.]